MVFTFSTPLPLCPIKESGTRTLTRWLFWDISLPSSSSAGFLNKVVFVASTSLSDSLACRVANRLSLDSVTVILFMISIWKITNLNQFSRRKENFPFKLNMTYSNLVNYTFVSGSETFIFFLSFLCICSLQRLETLWFPVALSAKLGRLLHQQVQKFQGILGTLKREEFT